MSYTAVVVDLKSTIDASNLSVDILDTDVYSAANIVRCVDISVADLSGVFLKFQEPTADRNTRVAQTIMAEQTFKDLLAARLATLDASGATDPFSSSHGSANTFAGVPELVLGCIAKVLFGHPQATAAITNDSSILSTVETRVTNEVNALWTALSASDNSAGGSLRALDIVEQVLGQDASRAMNVDNSEQAGDAWQNLVFVAGDKLYLHLDVKVPTINFPGGASGSAANNDAQAAFSGPTFADRAFDLEINIVA